MASEKKIGFVKSRNNAGASLVEILVTIIVLSIGALGAAAIQANSKNSNYESKQKLKAVNFVSGVLEKIHANPGGFRGVSEDDEASGIQNYTSSILDGTTMTAEPSPNCSKSSVCSSLELAKYDRWVWDQELANTYLEPELSITTNVRDVVTIKLTYWGPMELGSDASHIRSTSTKTYVN